jgi:two-component system cell cycle sensor histidine kinase/response regulator CckA
VQAQMAERPENRPYVLIVDDEVAVLEVTRSMACALGWRPLVANTAEAAYALYRQHPQQIHHVLLDLRMPGTDGAALARRLRKLEGGVHIVLMTGDETEAHALMAREPLADGLLVKPFITADLESALAETRPRGLTPTPVAENPT